ncbi:MAG: 50S ribosomal protein L19 [bacterium]|nr:50S ribosomal protein L19 [bacterium]
MKLSTEILNKIKPGAKVRVFSAGGGSARGGESTSSFTGIVLARKHGNETGATFTVRAQVAGVGVEKVFPINSPVITKVDVLSSPRKVHRAKYYMLRTLSQKRIRQKLSVS